MKQNLIDHNFKYHTPSPRKIQLHNDVREFGKEFAELINGLCNEGREKSLAITKVEEAVMWANAAIARSSKE